jgi:hypothetical protein
MKTGGDGGFRGMPGQERLVSGAAARKKSGSEIPIFISSGGKVAMVRPCLVFIRKTRMKVELLAQLATNLVVILQSNAVGGVLFICILLAWALILYLRKK